MASELTVQTIKGPLSGDNANKIIIPAGQTLSVSDGINLDDLPAGTVIQTLRSDINLGVFSDINTWHDGASITITPKFANSKILIMVNIQVTNGNATSLNCSIRDGSGNELSRFAEINQAGRYGQSGMAWITPGTTDPQTYKFSMTKESSNSGLTGQINNGEYSNMIVQEIKQ